MTQRSPAFEAEVDAEFPCDHEHREAHNKGVGLPHAVWDMLLRLSCQDLDQFLCDQIGYLRINGAFKDRLEPIGRGFDLSFSHLP